MIAFECPKCNTSLTAPDQMAGRASDCACGAHFVIPFPEPPRVIEYRAKPRAHEDEEPIPYRSRRRARKPLPGVIPVVGMLTALMLLIASSVCWEHLRELRRDSREYGLGQTGEFRKYRAMARITLIGAVGTWSVAMLMVAGRARRDAPVVSWGAIGALFGGIIAIPVSQFMPFVGDWLARLAEPWSPARLSTIGVHCFIFVACGAVAAGAIAAFNTAPQRRRR